MPGLSLLLALLLIDDAVDRYQVTEIMIRVDQFENCLLDRPLAMATKEKTLFVFDASFQLWLFTLDGEVIKVVGGKGEGPGEFSEPYRGLRMMPNQLEITHAAGFKKNIFSPAGGFLETEKATHHSLYFNPPDERINVWPEGFSFTNPDLSKARYTMNLVWEIGKTETVVPLLTEEDQDISFFDHCLFLGMGDYGMIVSTLSRRQTLYFVVLDLKKKTIFDHGVVPMLDMRGINTLHKLKPEASRVVVEGGTISDTLGFTVTERTVDGNHRFVRTYHPKDKTWKGLKVHYDEPDLYSFQHLKNDQWVAFSGGELVFFRLSPKIR